jgi:alpha-beta hydrolase superfamily lysophospholipase
VKGAVPGQARRGGASRPATPVGAHGEAPPERALYLSAGGQRFLALASPAEPAAQRTAVLLVPPFGWEDICSYRSRRDWARELAAGGRPALRMDLPGSGDSAGGPRDPGRLDAWIEAVDAGARWLADDSGAARIAAVGIGLGGLLACAAALRGTPIAELVLWAVPASGRPLVRELRAFSRLEVANEGGPPPEATPGEAPGRPARSAGSPPELPLAANGYGLSQETMDSLQALSLADPRLRSGELHVRRALLLGRDGMKTDASLRALLEELGVAVDASSGHGYGAMMAEPQDAVPPTAVFAEVDRWLAAGAAQPAPAGGEDLVRRTARPTGQPRASGAATAARETAPAAELELDVSGAPVIERVVTEPGPEGRQFGVLCEPAGARRELCGVLLNAGPQRHTGPNRMWVETARRWAALGVPTLRVDLPGIGDSDGDAAALVRVASLYQPHYVVRALQTLDLLAGRGMPQRFVMMGLCSGAYWSLHAALHDERVAAAVMLNPRALIWDEWVNALLRTRDLRERLFLRSTWRRVARGEITIARHLETARALAANVARRPFGRRRAPRSAPDSVETATTVEGLFDGLRERGQRGLLLLTGREPLREQFTESGLFDRLERWPNLEVVRTGTEADTHTLTPLWLQAEVNATVDRFLRRELELL